MIPELRSLLIAHAVKNETVTYGQIMKLFGFSHQQLHIELESVSRFENENQRPMLTVMAEYQDGGYGDPFFKLAAEFGYTIGPKNREFARKMQIEVHDHWKKAMTSSGKSYYVLGSKYGEQANAPKLPEMIGRSVISVGFYEGDLGAYYLQNEDDIKTFLIGERELPKSYNALKKFLQLKPGDIVAIKLSGSPRAGEAYLSIGAYAIVVEKQGKIYSYDPDDLGHCLNVEFIETDLNREFSIGGYGSTIARITEREIIAQLFNGYLEKDESLVKKRIRKRRASENKRTGTQQRRGSEPYVANMIHNNIQMLFKLHLVGKYGEEKVKVEEDFVDIKLDLDSEVIFYEVKPYHLVEDCIREGLGQLLCYGFSPKIRGPKNLLSLAHLNHQMKNRC
jgi:hypothetical protein